MTAQKPETSTPTASAPQQYTPPRAEQASGHAGARAPREVRTLTSKDVASELHRWGRMTGVFSILALVTWLLLDAVPTVSPTLASVKSTFLWPGITLAILAGIGLIGGFGIQLFAGHRR